MFKLKIHWNFSYYADEIDPKAEHELMVRFFRGEIMLPFVPFYGLSITINSCNLLLVHDHTSPFATLEYNTDDDCFLYHENWDSPTQKPFYDEQYPIDVALNLLEKEFSFMTEYDPTEDDAKDMGL